VRYPSLIVAVLIAPSLAFAVSHATASDQRIIVTRSVEQTRSIDPVMVEQLSAVEETISFLTAHGSEQARYTSALLWSVLDSAEILRSDRGCQSIARTAASNTPPR
jgi:hypothetical protein